MARVKADVVMRYKEMIFEEKRKYLKLKDKMELSKLKIEYLQDEQEIIKKIQ